MDINSGKALTNEKSIDQSISLILLTAKGERVLNRDFGSKVATYLDAPINEVSLSLSAEITQSLEQEDSRIKVSKVTLKQNNKAGNEMQGNKMQGNNESSLLAKIEHNIGESNVNI